MILLFKIYLLRKVSILVDLVNAFAVVRRKRRIKSFQVKKTDKQEMQLPVINILGSSKTKITPSNLSNVLGVSKTEIQDFSPYVQESDEDEQSICLSLFNDNDEDNEINLVEEEIPLEIIKATGVSIQDIERINSVVKQPDPTGEETRSIATAVNELSQADLSPSDKISFQTKINTLLDRLELVHEGEDQNTNANMELDKLFQ